MTLLPFALGAVAFMLLSDIILRESRWWSWEMSATVLVLVIGVLTVLAAT